MARRRRSSLDDWLEAWARWCHAGGLAQDGAPSVLARLIEARGVLIVGTAGPTAPLDDIEGCIEAAVMALAQCDPMAADVLRLECGAGWSDVARRRGLTGYDPRGMAQFDIAHALGVSVRTYRRKLAKARETVVKELNNL